MRFAIAALGLLACTKEASPQIPSSYRFEEVNDLVARHHDGMDVFEGILVFNDGNPRYPANQGNGNLFSGLLCYAELPDSCHMLEALRCPDGHLKRAPWRVCGDESRDEYLGQAFGALKTRSVFPLPGSFPFGATPTWSRSMQLAGFAIKGPSGAAEHALLLAEAKTVPLGYRLHLAALQAWERRIKGESSRALDLTFVALRERDPGNLFFRYLRSGPTNEVIDAFLAWAPPEPVAKQAQWTWQDPPGVYGSTKVHSGAIVFLGKMLMKGARK